MRATEIVYMYPLENNTPRHNINNTKTHGKLFKKLNNLRDEYTTFEELLLKLKVTERISPTIFLT